MQPLNYCRQFIIDTTAAIDAGQIARDRVEECRGLMGLAGGAQKFLLPEGGVVLDDPIFTALDEDVELHLPYEVIALEFQTVVNGRTLKHILIAMEHDGNIACVPVVGKGDIWAPSVAGYIPVKDFRTPDGWRHYYAGRLTKPYKGGPIPEDEKQSLHYYTEILLLFLNVLACSNVETVVNEPRKQPKAKSGMRQFDPYHVLQVRPSGGSGEGGGSHRSPREHLRRGHIRRLPTGKKIWINAVVVNPGTGVAVVKDYTLK